MHTATIVMPAGTNVEPTNRGAAALLLRVLLVVALAGIGSAELARYKTSSDFGDSGGAVLQPGPDAPGPHMNNYPPGRYEKILAMTDAEMLATSETEPPVRV